MNDRSDGKSLSFCLPSLLTLCVCMCVRINVTNTKRFIFISVYVEVTTRNSSFFHERFLQSHFGEYDLNTNPEYLHFICEGIKLQKKKNSILFLSVSLSRCASKHIFSIIRVCRVEFGGLNCVLTL